jgi:cellobiose phosphorylase
MNLTNSHGLTIEFLENGAVKSINADPIRISLKAASPFSLPGANIYLRKRTDSITFKPLLGPGSDCGFQISEDDLKTFGNWDGIEYTCTIRLARNSNTWYWNIDLENRTGEDAELDLVYMQDVGLKPVNAGLQNEYYVSQYLERILLDDEKYGKVACCRQNMKESTGYPWIMLACLNGAIAGTTDGMQFYGRTYRETGIPEGLLLESLPGEYAGESPVFALQEKPFILVPGERHQTVFVGIYMADHIEATSVNDLTFLNEALINSPNRPIVQSPNRPIVQSSNRPIVQSSNDTGTPSLLLPVTDLNNDELKNFFGNEKRHTETENGKLLSFFSSQNHHIVLRAKEILADRPHAHIMQAQAGFAPDENIMSTTSFMFGVFNSHITQGNTNFNVLLSVCTSQFNQSPESGQRIFVEIDGIRYLLGVPSAFEIGLNHCRWIYKHGDHCFQVRTWTSKKVPQVNLDFRVISGSPVKLIITHDFDPLDGWKIMPGAKTGEYIARPKPGSMIAGKFPNAQYRTLVNGEHTSTWAGQDHGNSLFIVDVPPTAEFSMSFIGEVCKPVNEIKIENADQQWLSDCKDAYDSWADLGMGLSLESDNKDVAAIREILPWFGMNALTHFLTPYGLEQFSGAAWGTRDVSQGPVDLLLTTGKYAEAKQVLRTIFSNQESTGGWPQWWMFDSYANIRSDSSHDDIYYWCLIALAGYIKVTGDIYFLDEIIPYYHEKGLEQAEKTMLREHIDRLISMITSSFIRGTALVPFGGGDWNDSLQPVSKDLAQRMISSWTVEMSYQAFSQYLGVFETTGDLVKAAKLKEICERIKTDFNKHLVKDGIVAGYGLVEADGSISVMLHPTDNRTGVHYSILPMERGILSGIFTKEQSLHHQELIEQHLKGPDGARLMDKPLKYKGGIQEIFQRAESSTFFGREIGLMYVHEHIRYAEALARTGKADAFVKALRQAIPVGYRDVVPCGDIRQSNCYYSSSDVHFKNRYEADEHYDEALTGKLTLRGGWRVYSSGPGIYIGIVITKLLGLRIESGNVIIDPGMPYSFDGLSARLTFMGHQVKFVYSVKEGNYSPKTITINGNAVPFNHEENLYRKGGAVIPAGEFSRLMAKGENTVEVRL